MKHIIAALFWALLVVPCCGWAADSKDNANPAEGLVLQTENDKLSYAAGVGLARNFIWSKVQLDQSGLVAGLTDAYAGNQLLLSETELRIAMNTYRGKMAEAGKFKRLPGNVSYAIGVDTARKLQPLGISFNLDALAAGLRDALSGNQLLIDDRELRLMINEFQLDLKQRRTKARAMAGKSAQGNKAAPEAAADGSPAAGRIQNDGAAQPRTGE